jgi:hypothetical protein
MKELLNTTWKGLSILLKHVVPFTLTFVILIGVALAIQWLIVLSISTIGLGWTIAIMVGISVLLLSFIIGANEESKVVWK